MTGLAVPADDGLRARLLGAICRCLDEDPATADPAEVDDLMRHLIPEVRAYAEQRAAEELRAAYWATAAIPDPEAVREVVNARAAALSAAHNEEPGQ